MTKKEKQLLRVALAIIQNVIISDNGQKAKYIDECIRQHPERYEKEFITETGFSREEIAELLKVRSERLQERQTEVCAPDRAP